MTEPRAELDKVSAGRDPGACMGVAEAMECGKALPSVSSFAFMPAAFRPRLARPAGRTLDRYGWRTRSLPAGCMSSRPCALVAGEERAGRLDDPAGACRFQRYPLALPVGLRANCHRTDLKLHVRPREPECFAETSTSPAAVAMICRYGGSAAAISRSSSSRERILRSALTEARTFASIELTDRVDPLPAQAPPSEVEDAAGGHKRAANGPRRVPDLAA